jgi:hypothetical protein
MASLRGQRVRCSEAIFFCALLFCARGIDTHAPVAKRHGQHGDDWN